jgi:hypothetical protein
MLVWRFIRKLFKPSEADRSFILKNLTLEEMEQIMGRAQVNIARQQMGLPPLPDHEDKDQATEK